MLANHVNCETGSATDAFAMTLADIFAIYWMLNSAQINRYQSLSHAVVYWLPFALREEHTQFNQRIYLRSNQLNYVNEKHKQSWNWGTNLLTQMDLRCLRLSTAERTHEQSCLVLGNTAHEFLTAILYLSVS